MGGSKELQGRTGTRIVSAFVKFLASLFMCEVDVQIGNGRINYINGYVSKDHDSVDVGLGEYVQKDSCSSWLATYRLLSKSSPGLPEVAIRMASLSEFDRSYSHVLLYPPQPAAMVQFEGRQGNFSARMYGFYLQEMRDLLSSGQCVYESFLVWHRCRQYDAAKNVVVLRAPKHQQHKTPTYVTACRYWYELTDGYWGQVVLTQLPHLHATDLLPQQSVFLVCMQNFVGMLEYLCSWRLEDLSIISTRGGCRFRMSALPFLIDEEGDQMRLGTGVANSLVFSSDRQAFEYIHAIAQRDLQYRGFRDDRLSCFHFKNEANFCLYQRVKACGDQHEYEMYRQSWDTINRPKHRCLA